MKRVINSSFNQKQLRETPERQGLFKNKEHLALVLGLRRGYFHEASITIHTPGHFQF